MVPTLYSPLHISVAYMLVNPNEGIIQRLPFSKVNMFDIKSFFWSEKKLNINAAPSSTYVYSSEQDKLIKDQ